MRTSITLTLVAGLFVLVLGSGCVAALVGGAAAGAGTVAYVRGELTATESVSLDKAWSAAQEAMKDLQLTMFSQRKDGLSATLEATKADGKKIHIKLTKAAETETKIQIRVGVFGDQTWSRTILDQMKKHF